MGVNWQNFYLGYYPKICDFMKRNGVGVIVSKNMGAAKRSIEPKCTGKTNTLLSPQGHCISTRSSAEREKKRRQTSPEFDQLIFPPLTSKNKRSRHNKKRNEDKHDSKIGDDFLCIDEKVDIAGALLQLQTLSDREEENFSEGLPLELLETCVMSFEENNDNYGNDEKENEIRDGGKDNGTVDDQTVEEQETTNSNTDNREGSPNKGKVNEIRDGESKVNEIRDGGGVEKETVEDEEENIYLNNDMAKCVHDGDSENEFGENTDNEGDIQNEISVLDMLESYNEQNKNLGTPPNENEVLDNNNDNTNPITLDTLKNGNREIFLNGGNKKSSSNTFAGRRSKRVRKRLKESESAENHIGGKSVQRRDRALEEIRKYQKCTKLLIQSTPFIR